MKIAHTFLIFISCLFLNCKTSDDCIKFGQGCVNSTDHGFVRIFVSDRKCNFVKMYESIADNDLFNSNHELWKKKAELKQSAQIVNRNCNRDIKLLLEKFITYDDFSNCAISVEILDSNENVLKIGSISISSLRQFEREFYAVARKYNLDETLLKQIKTYFSIIHKGQEMIM